MVTTTLAWTTDEITDWLIEAARTAHRLPPVRVQGYFNVWPAFVRTPFERMAHEEEPVQRLPPTPAEIERMLVVMQWVQCLEVEQRKLVWMRAERWRWQDIGKRFGVAPRTAQRRWDVAIQTLAAHLSRGV